MSILALCLVSAVLAALLRKDGPALALMLALAAVVVVAGLLSRTLGQIVDMIRELIAAADLAPELFSPLIKTVAIALISRVGSELCRDAGEGALSAAVEMAGAFGAVLVSLPLFRAVWDMLQMMV